jgi:tryptophan synthase alpha subunit
MGEIVAERYADGFGIHTSQRTWSVAKSLAGTIIGAAVQKGLIDLRHRRRCRNGRLRATRERRSRSIS